MDTCRTVPEAHGSCQEGGVSGDNQGLSRSVSLVRQLQASTYIKPEMAKALFERARGPKDLWVVPKAKHNQALNVAEDEYHRRLVAFFDQYLK